MSTEDEHDGGSESVPAARPGPGPSWQSDPFGRHEQRWWDGGGWTEKVRSSGVTGIDPPGVVARPEAPGASNARAEPITDAALPVRFVPMTLPRTLLLGVVLLALIVLLVLVGIATA